LTVLCKTYLTEKGGVADWKFLAPTYQGSLDLSLFEKGSWGGEFHPELIDRENALFFIVVVENTFPRF